MAVIVGTSPNATATAREGGRKILRTSNGTIWVVMHQGANQVPILRYSTDDGANWSTSSTAFPESFSAPTVSWTYCSDGAIYMLYQDFSLTDLWVRKGTLNGAHTDITWSSRIIVTTSFANSVGLVAHEEDGNTYVHVVYANSTTLCEYKRAVWGSAFGSTQTLTSWSGATAPKIEFHHTLADTTAVKDSAPHVYVSWFENNKVMFRKLVFSSGPSWAWNAARIITSDAKDYNSFAMSFDGTSIAMLIESLGTAEALLVLERDSADTTTTLTNTPTRTGTSVPYTDITYSPERDIEVFHTDLVAKVLQRVIYDRSGSSWGSWVTVDADADDLYPNVKVGYWSGSKANAIELIWMDSSPDPDEIMHERFTFTADSFVEVVEAANTTDNTLIERELYRIATEAAGTTDAVAVGLEIYRTIADLTNTTDSVAFLLAREFAEAIAEAAGTTDAVTTLLRETLIYRTATEAANTTDAVAVVVLGYPATMDLTSDSHLVRMPTSHGIRTRLDRFYARFDYRYMGLAVLATETAPGVWTITEYPGIEVIDNDAALAASEIFYGGRVWAVAGSLANALTAAGYDVIPD